MSSFDPKVPNYDLSGAQNFLHPVVNKEHLKDVKPLWQGEPKHKTRSELLAARRAEKTADPSYDLDCDGVVGQRDMFIAKRFDFNRDSKLDHLERKECMRALSSGWLDKFATGLDQAGAARRFNTYQSMGVVFTSDAHAQAGSLYPPHPLAAHEPLHQTKSELHAHRKLLQKTKGAKIGENMSSSLVPERQPPAQTHVPPIHNIKERAEADAQAARVAGGLLPVSVGVNPIREEKHIGMDYVAEPVVKSRSQLVHARKFEKRENLYMNRLKGDEEVETMAAVLQQVSSPLHSPVTRSAMVKERKSEFIEYNARHFVHKEPVPQQQEGVWWTGLDGRKRADEKNRVVAEYAAGLSQEATSAPVFKISQSRLPEKLAGGETSSTAPLIAPTVEAPTEPNGGSSRKRWSTEVIERGIGKDSRLFDSLPQPQALIRDFQPIEVTSSFAVIKDKVTSQMEQAKARHRHVPTVSKQKSQL